MALKIAQKIISDVTSVTQTIGAMKLPSGDVTSFTQNIEAAESKSFTDTESQKRFISLFGYGINQLNSNMGLIVLELQDVFYFIFFYGGWGRLQIHHVKCLNFEIVFEATKLQILYKKRRFSCY